MIKITNYRRIHNGPYDIMINYVHGEYMLQVTNVGNVDVYLQFDINKYRRIPNHKEYEEFLKIDLQLHEIYKGEEL